jgi:hypothetical protein
MWVYLQFPRIFAPKVYQSFTDTLYIQQLESKAYCHLFDSDSQGGGYV